MAVSTATLRMVLDAQDKASGVLGSVAGSLGKVAGIAAGAVTGGLAAAGAAMMKLAVDAAALPAIAEGFENNMEKYGLAAEEMVGRLQEASGGTVSAFELMKRANLALTGAGKTLGNEFGSKLPQLMEIARAAARNTGQDVDFLFESIVTGIKRGSPMIIDNLGLVLKISEANDAYAASLGKTAEELTAEERSIAILNATLEAGQGILETVNLSQLTAAERIATLRTRFADLKDSIGVMLQPALERLLGIIEPLLDRLFVFASEHIPLVADKITDLVSKFGGLVTAILDTGATSETTRDALATLVGEETAGKIMNVIGWIEKLRERFNELKAAFQEGGLRGLLDEIFGEETAGKIMNVIGWLDKNKVALLGAAAAFFVVLKVASVVLAVIAVFGAVIALVTSPVFLLAVAIGALVFVIIKYGPQAWQTILMIGDILRAVFGRIRFVLEQLKHKWEVAWLWFKTATQVAWEAIVTNIKVKLGKIISKITGITASIYQAGRDLWQGFWNGIRERYNEFIGWLRKKLDYITTLTNRIFGNRSPSSVFEGIGENLMAGLARGIEKGVRLPELALGGTSTGMIAQQSQLTLTAPSAGSRTLNIETVYINNGMDLARFRAMLKDTLG